MIQRHYPRTLRNMWFAPRALLVNRHYFYSRTTENDADSQKGPCVHTAWWESGPKRVDYDSSTKESEVTVLEITAHDSWPSYLSPVTEWEQ